MIDDTIFEPSFGNRPARLVGRKDVVQQIDVGLAARPGSRERAILLLGQRGSGKTVLLWEIADRAREAGFVVANPVVSGDDMLERIVEKIQDDGQRFVKGRRGKLTGGSIGVLGVSLGLNFSQEEETKSFQYKLTHLCRTLTEQGHGVLILVDEVQANSPEMRQLVSAYLEAVGEGLNIAIAMAGLPGAISATLNEHVLTFLNRARKITLGPLPEAEVEAYYTTSFAQLGMKVEQAQCAKAAQEGHQSPYLMQLIGHNMALFAADDGTMSDEVFNRALRRAQEDFENDVCKTTLAALSEKDRSFLRAMAQDDHESAMADVAARMGVTSDYAQKYRTRLIDSGAIEAHRRGYVSFAVPYLADYLRNDFC